VINTKISRRRCYEDAEIISLYCNLLAVDTAQFKILIVSLFAVKLHNIGTQADLIRFTLHPSCHIPQKSSYFDKNDNGTGLILHVHPDEVKILSVAIFNLLHHAYALLNKVQGYATKYLL
jgi:hypothetical protein